MFKFRTYWNLVLHFNFSTVLLTILNLLIFPAARWSFQKQLQFQKSWDAVWNVSRNTTQGHKPIISSKGKHRKRTECWTRNILLFHGKWEDGKQLDGSNKSQKCWDRDMFITVWHPLFLKQQSVNIWAPLLQAELCNRQNRFSKKGFKFQFIWTQKFSTLPLSILN